MLFTEIDIPSITKEFAKYDGRKKKFVPLQQQQLPSETSPDANPKDGKDDKSTKAQRERESLLIELQSNGQQISIKPVLMPYKLVSNLF